MSWNDKLPFAESLARLTVLASKPARIDRPDSVRRGDIRLAHSVFQARLFAEDLHKDEAHVAELTRALLVKPADRRFLDPVLVMAIGNHFTCVDGHHRLLAYRASGVHGEIPVEHMPAGSTIADGMLAGTERNARDRLAMTHSDKLEAAWRLVVVDAHSKAEIAEATGSAASTIGTMRATLKRLQERERDIMGYSWAEAKAELKGHERKEFSDEAAAWMTRDWAKRFGKTFGKKALGQPGIFADALELYSGKLPRSLVEHWTHLAVEVVQEMREADELPDAF